MTPDKLRFGVKLTS